MSKKLEWPITVEKLEEFGGPDIIRVSPEILAIVAGYDNTTIDLTLKQAREFYLDLGDMLDWIDDKR